MCQRGPLTGNALVAWNPTKVVIRALDGHEALQHLSVQHARGELSRLVAHEAVDEGESGLRDSNATEGQI